MSEEGPEPSAGDIPDPGAIDEALGGPAPMDGEDGEADPLESPDEAMAGDSPSQSWDDQLLDSLTRPPAKTIHDIDESEYFDPENGGKKRLMLVADDMITQGDGLQNWMHICIGLVEIVISEADGSSEADETEQDGAQTEKGTSLEETPMSEVELA